MTPSPRIVPVDLGARSYQVRIGPGLIPAAPAHLAPLLARPRVAIVTDETVAALHLPALVAALEGAGIAATALALPAGEATKGWDQLGRTVDWLLAERGPVYATADLTLRVGERDSVEVTGQRLLDLLAQSRPDLFDPAERARIGARAVDPQTSSADEGP